MLFRRFFRTVHYSESVRRAVNDVRGCTPRSETRQPGSQENSRCSAGPWGVRAAARDRMHPSGLHGGAARTSRRCLARRVRGRVRTGVTSTRTEAPSACGDHTVAFRDRASNHRRKSTGAPIQAARKLARDPNHVDCSREPCSTRTSPTRAIRSPSTTMLILSLRELVSTSRVNVIAEPSLISPDRMTLPPADDGAHRTFASTC